MADKTPMVLDATSASGLGKLQVGDRLSPASIPSFKIENTKYVDDSGDDGTGDGSINRPYKTIAHALTVARPGLDSIVVGNGTYTENLTLVGDVPILADISSIPQQVKIVGSHVLPSSGLVAFSYINFQCTSGYLFTLGGTKSPNVIIESCTMNIQSGASGCFEWITTNVNARVNILNSVINIYGNSGYAINCISSVAGKVNLQYTSVQSLVNPNNVIINLTGSITVTHTFDVIIGQIVVAGSSAYNGTSLTMVTGNTPILTTTSSGISSFGLCSINTTSANVVTGVGGFVYGFIGYTNTGSNLNNTLNGGTGAICGQSAPLRLDNSALPTNLQAGLFNYDGTNFYLDLSTSNRVRIATSDKTTGIIPTAQLPIATLTTMGTNFANQAITQYNTSSTINVSELPSNAIGAFYNASSSPITLTLPSGSSYQFVSTVLGNTATAITLQAGDIFSFIYNGANIFVIGYTATGSNINVLNPTTATITSLNTALASIANGSSSSTIKPCFNAKVSGLLTNNPEKVSFANNMYQLTGYGTGLYYGYDGQAYIQSNITSGNYLAPVYANGSWVASSINNQGVLYSLDGKLWQQTSLITGSFSQATFANGKWIISKVGGGIYYSSDGVTWTQSNITSGTGGKATYGNSVWVVGMDGATGVLYSSDAITWTQSNLTGVSASTTTFGNGKFIVAIFNGGLRYSVDGINWNATNITTGSTTTLYFGNGTFVAGINGTLASSIYSSTDAITWTQSNISNSVLCRSVSYGNGSWVAATDNGLYFGNNILNLTNTNIGFASYSTAFGNGTFICGTAQGCYFTF